MTPDQTKKKVEEFVEKLVKEKHKNKFYTADLTTTLALGETDRIAKSILHRTIIFALELAREAGPEIVATLCNCDDHPSSEVPNDCPMQYGHNAALTAKNSAIQELIEAVKK